jgi:hypothetical protein
MPKLLKKTSFLVLALTTYLSLPFPAHAQTKPWQDINTKCFDATLEIATLQGFECIFANILGIIVPIAGLASFVILIIGGFQYLTSAGDPKQTQKASSIITGAIIGLAVTMGVWFIFRLIKDITGIDLFWFKVPSSDP